MLGIGSSIWNSLSAQWWPDGAIYAADFVNDRYMRGGLNIAAADAFSLTRSTAKFADDGSGVWRSFAPNVLARTDRGALIETASDNYVPNSAFAGAQPSATNLLDGLPTGWERSKFDGTSVNGRILAVDTWLGLPSLTLRLWGNSFVGDAELRGGIWSNITTGLPTVQGNTTVHSIFVQRVAGSNTNFSPRLRLTERNSAGEYLGNQTTPFVPTDMPVRALTTLMVSSTTAAYALGGLAFSFSGAFDITLRLAASQLSPTALLAGSSPVIGITVPTNRADDAITLSLPLGTQTIFVTFRDGTTQLMASTGGNQPISSAALNKLLVSQVFTAP